MNEEQYRLTCARRKRNCADQQGQGDARRLHRGEILTSSLPASLACAGPHRGQPLDLRHDPVELADEVIASAPVFERVHEGPVVPELSRLAAAEVLLLPDLLAQVAIVGATGSIGKTCAQLLAKKCIAAKLIGRSVS